MLLSLVNKLRLTSKLYKEIFIQNVQMADLCKLMIATMGEHYGEPFTVTL